MAQVTAAPMRTHHFSRVPTSDAPTYSTFDLSHRHLTAINAGYVIPIEVLEVEPGDIIKQSSNHLTRMLTPIVPFMQNLDLDCHYWYVRNREIMHKWVNLQGEQRNPNDSVDYRVPMLNSGKDGVPVGSIFDYAGVPPLVPNLSFSALPFRAMNYIYNYKYRDENLQEWRNVGGTGTSSNPVDEFGQTDQLSNYSLWRRSIKADYFSTCLPWQQKGSPVIMSLNGNAPVVGNGYGLGVTTSDQTTSVGYLNPYLPGGSPHNSVVVTSGKTEAEAVGTAASGAANQTLSVLGVTQNPELSGLVADMSNVTGINIADFVTAMQIQAIRNLDARSGTRYKEAVAARFKVNISDATLDEPEFLGGSRGVFQTTPVANTTGTNADPQGSLSAYSVCWSENFDFIKGIEEHGWIIGFVSIRTSDNLYSQGLDRMFSRETRFDFHEPLLDHIIDQPVKNKEIYAQGASVVDDDGNVVDEGTFGYQEAWADYRFKNSYCTGLMRPQVPNSLYTWHLGFNFSELPNFNSDFIESNPRVSDVVAIQNQPQFQCDNYFRIKATRELPVYSVPAYLGMRL